MYFSSEKVGDYSLGWRVDLLVNTEHLFNAAFNFTLHKEIKNTENKHMIFAKLHSSFTYLELVSL